MTTAFDQYDIAMMGFLLGVLVFALLATYIGQRRKRGNRYRGLPAPKADDRSSIQQFTRIVGRG